VVAVSLARNVKERVAAHKGQKPQDPPIS